MEQIKAHIAVSLDGHTATPDYELDWMPREVKELAAREHAAASCLLMGANTYNYIFEHWGGWPHKSKRSFVVSHYDTNVTPDCGVEFLTEEPLQRVYELKQETDMLVVGGGKLLLSGKHPARCGSSRKAGCWITGWSVRPTCLAGTYKKMRPVSLRAQPLKFQLL